MTFGNHWSKLDPQSLVDLVNRAKEVYEYGSLLWFMAYSRILENHLKVLDEKKWLKLPVNSQKQLDLCFEFTGFARTKN